MLEYKFVNLELTQLEQRRRLLDQAGFHAWLSPIVLLLFVYSYRQLFHRHSTSVSSSKSTASLSSIQGLSRRIAWVLNTTYIPEFGALHVQLVGTAYLAWLLYLISRGTGNDYMHLTKAFGHVAISQLPMQYLLSVKTPYSPITIATGLTHERLNAYHRLFGRIVHLLLATHATLYLNFFIQIGVLAKRARDRDVILGLIAFGMFNVLGLLALPSVRKRHYFKAFYQNHVVITALVAIVLFFHVPYTRVYVVQAAVFWLGGGVVRLAESREVEVQCEKVDDSELVKVTISGLGGGSTLPSWIPGQHVYLNRGTYGPKNPYTIASGEKGNDGLNTEMQLVVRNLKGLHTGYLASLASSQEKTRLRLEGPYGEASMYIPDLLAQGQNAGQILLVAGGVGGTYTLPIYLALLKAKGNSTGVQMVWLAKSLADVLWGLDKLSQTTKEKNVTIYITQRSKQTTQKDLKPTDGVTIIESTGRPDLHRVVGETFQVNPKREITKTGKQGQDRAEGNHEKISILVCGPAGLSQSLRHAVGKYVFEHGREVDWYEEQFGFGGS